MGRHNFFTYIPCLSVWIICNLLLQISRFIKVHSQTQSNIRKCFIHLGHQRRYIFHQMLDRSFYYSHMKFVHRLQISLYLDIAVNCIASLYWWVFICIRRHRNVIKSSYVVILVLFDMIRNEKNSDLFPDKKCSIIFLVI